MALVLCPVDVSVTTEPIGLVVSPLAFVAVSINMSELALSVCFVVLPLPNVLSSIWPVLLSIPVSHCTFPLTYIDCS